MTSKFVQLKSDETALTINCHSIVTYNANKDNPTFFAGFYYGRHALWMAVLTPISPLQTLPQTITVGPVTLYAGLRVQLQDLGNSFNVLLTGTIGDVNGPTSFNSSNIGSFPSNGFAEVIIGDTAPNLAV